jgi:membrane protein
MARPGLLTILKRAGGEFVEDECPRMAAALSYYVVFSLPSLLVLVLLVAGWVWGGDAAEGELSAQIDALMGGEAAEALRDMLEQGEDPGAGRGIAAVFGFAALAFGATGAFIELQNALNRAWNVAPDPEAGGLRNFVTKRLLSIGMVLSIAFLLLVSLALSAMLSAFGGTLAAMLPADVSAWALRGVDLGLSLAVITLLFAAMFRVLPDARIAWRDVWVGAAATTVLFLVGKFGIGFYLGQSNPGEAFGAAGALAVLLVWIYYSAMIFLFGAEFTQVWANTRGQGVEPEDGAIRIGDDPGPTWAEREAAAAVAEAELHPSRPEPGASEGT